MQKKPLKKRNTFSPDTKWLERILWNRVAWDTNHRTTRKTSLNIPYTDADRPKKDADFLNRYKKIMQRNFHYIPIRYKNKDEDEENNDNDD